MKISNSKKELARIISENGGWRDGNYAVQDRDDKKVWFMRALAGRPDGAPFWPGVKSRGIPYSKVLTNWHQTALSRAEYFHLYPVPDADGWIEWGGGGDAPVSGEVFVDVQHADDDVESGCAGDMNWGWENARWDIIAYRLHKPEQAKSSAVGDDETNLAAKRELEAMECKPTIEQLAADYSNLLDFAQRKQQEADDAKADVGAKLKALKFAAEDLGFKIEPITTKQDGL